MVARSDANSRVAVIAICSNSWSVFFDWFHWDVISSNASSRSTSLLDSSCDRFKLVTSDIAAAADSSSSADETV